MQTAKKTIVEKLGRGTSLTERQAAMRARADKTLRIVRANQEKAQGSLRIKLVQQFLWRSVGVQFRYLGGSDV